MHAGDRGGHERDGASIRDDFEAARIHRANRPDGPIPSTLVTAISKQIENIKWPRGPSPFRAGRRWDSFTRMQYGGGSSASRRVLNAGARGPR